MPIISVELRGKYSMTYTCGDMGTAKAIVNVAKARTDVTLIRVRLPTGDMRTIAWQGNTLGWVGEL